MNLIREVADGSLVLCDLNAARTLAASTMGRSKAPRAAVDNEDAIDRCRHRAWVFMSGCRIKDDDKKAILKFERGSYLKGDHSCFGGRTNRHEGRVMMDDDIV